MMIPTLQTCRVLPVVTPTDAESTVRLAQALQRGGMTAIEITLRTPAALDSIRAVRDQVPGMLVAAGTVTNTADGSQVMTFELPSDISGEMQVRAIDTDSQNNRTTIRLTNQKFGEPVSDNSFRWNDPRRTGVRK